MFSKAPEMHNILKNSKIFMDFHESLIEYFGKINIIDNYMRAKKNTAHFFAQKTGGTFSSIVVSLYLGCIHNNKQEYFSY